MASPGERSGPAVSDRLKTAPHRFEFFQAVRLWQRLARRAYRRAGKPEPAAVGHTGPPHAESLRFRTLPSHTFPAGQIASLRQSPAEDGEPWAPAEMVVTFLGLTGPAGVLPQHYTQLVIDRTRHKDFALRDFLDLFHHRTISLFQRAWEKYRYPIGIELAALDADAVADMFTRCLYCLVGLGSGEERFGEGALRNRIELSDEVQLYYGGYFAHWPRNATSLETMIGDFWQLPMRVLQFQGQWLRLAREDQTSMPTRGTWGNTNTRLGVDTVAGERIWSVEHRFRIRLGPLTYDQFQRFTPPGRELTALAQLVRMYVGVEFDFDVQPVLLAREVPGCRLGGEPAGASRLGWNTWLQSMPRQSDAEDAVFVAEGRPSSRRAAPSAA